MITFIYQRGFSGKINIHGQQKVETIHTYAYQRLNSDNEKYFVVAVTLSEWDKNDKNKAKEFATEKLNRLLKIYNTTEGRMVPKGKYFFKILDRDQLMKLKFKVENNNNDVDSIEMIQRHLYRSKW